MTSSQKQMLPNNHMLIYIHPITSSEVVSTIELARVYREK